MATYEDGGKIHMPAGAVSRPRPTTLIQVEDNMLKKTKVDGETQNKPQPH